MSISDKADWNRLVENKRKYSSQLHDLTKKLIDLDCQITDLNNRIRNQRTRRLFERIKYQQEDD